MLITLRHIIRLTAVGSLGDCNQGEITTWVFSIAECNICKTSANSMVVCHINHTIARLVSRWIWNRTRQQHPADTEAQFTALWNSKHPRFVKIVFREIGVPCKGTAAAVEVDAHCVTRGCVIKRCKARGPKGYQVHQVTHTNCWFGAERLCLWLTEGAFWSLVQAGQTYVWRTAVAESSSLILDCMRQEPRLSCNLLPAQETVYPWASRKTEFRTGSSQTKTPKNGCHHLKGLLAFLEEKL